MFGLADCNNFFVSCERAFRPDLEGRAVVVLSNNDGCAVSRSNEAKRLGIKMGQPVYQFDDLVRSGKVTVFSSNFVLYGDMSRRVQLTLRQAAPAIEVYSIDESFLDLNGMVDVDFDRYAKSLSATCLRNTGIPVSVGVAPTKTLAKIASKLCKQYPRLQGGCYMHRSEDIEKVLSTFPVEDVWGIGRRYSQRMHNDWDIHTALQFAQADQAWVRKQMGVSGLRTWSELNGVPCIEFEHCTQPKQQICVSRSFAREITDPDDLAAQVSLFCAMACEKLRKQHSSATQATVFMLTNRHRELAPQSFDSLLITFPTATNSTLEINKAVMNALRTIFRKGYGYKKAGVVLSGFVPSDQVQASFFDTTNRELHSRLMETIDSINRSHGSAAVTLGSQSRQGVRMNRRHLSPCYTTSFDDIITVKVDD